MTSPTTQSTDFSRDILGRYTCNGLDEALQSVQPPNRPDALRPSSRITEIGLAESP